MADIYEYNDSLDVYFNDVKGIKKLTQEEEVELCKKIKEGDNNALNKLVECNLRFVVSIAKLYRGRGVPFADLISEGNIGLITAARRYDPSPGYRFISYAVWWVKSAIQSHIDAFSKQCEYEEGIEKYADVDYDRTSSLINEEFNTCISDIEYRDNTVNQLINALDERERKILTLYFGLNGTKQFTLEEIGSEMNLTGERVRQLMNTAIVKIKCGVLTCDDFDGLKRIYLESSATHY